MNASTLCIILLFASLPLCLLFLLSIRKDCQCYIQENSLYTSIFTFCIFTPLPSVKFFYTAVSLPYRTLKKLKYMQLHPYGGTYQPFSDLFYTGRIFPWVPKIKNNDVNKGLVDHFKTGVLWILRNLCVNYNCSVSMYSFCRQLKQFHQSVVLENKLEPSSWLTILYLACSY